MDRRSVPEGIDPVEWQKHALLSAGQMMHADALAVEGGIDGYDLMLAAGQAIAQMITEQKPNGPGKVVFLCGPGKNGGDGFVAARLLSDAGWFAKVALWGTMSDLVGEAARAASEWTGETSDLSSVSFEGCDMIVDALFGIGLNRDLNEDISRTLQKAHESKARIIAVDIPTGIMADSGQCFKGALQRADQTVTFFKPKPAHYLLPGREKSGDLHVADIGIPETVLQNIPVEVAFNDPSLWQEALPQVTPYSHKYNRGYVVIAGGAEKIGAACLAARGAQRAGAGIVTLAVPVQQGPLYRLALEAAVVRSIKDTRAFIDLISDDRMGAAVIGPGLGVHTPGNHEKVLAVLKSDMAAVLDADALTLFEEAPEAFFQAITGPVVLTPHEGEFGRLFPDLADIPDKTSRARQAAQRSGATIVLKGYDSIIASPEGKAIVNGNAPPGLATAGAGDVLCGVIAALLAGGMPAFAAAAAGVYIHGEAANSYGPGLISSDLPDLLPVAMASLFPTA